MKYKGIIFDFNGVLLWDGEWHYEAWQIASRQLRGTPFSDQEYQNLIGRTNREILPYVFKRELSEKEVDQGTEYKENIYRNLALSKGDELRLSPGAEQLLNLVVQNKIPHTIATSSERGNVDFFIKNLGLERWFETRDIVFDDGTVPGKPAPDLYLRAADKLGLQPHECVVIEDSRSGIASAKAAGAGKIIAVGLKEKRTELLKWGANEVVENLGQLTMGDF